MSLNFNEPIKRDRYILGDNIAAYICAYYNPNYIIIAEPLKSFEETIYYSESAIKFFIELDVPFKIKTVIAGIKKGAQVYDEFSNSLVEEYFLVSRITRKADAYDYLNIIQPVEKIIQYDVSKLRKKITNKICIIKDSINRVDVEHRILYSQINIYYFSHLLVTLPRNIFLGKCDIFFIGRYCPYTEFLIYTKKEVMPKKYDKLYVMDERYHSIIRGNKPNYYIYRYAGFKKRRELLDYKPIKGIKLSGYKINFIGYCYGKPDEFVHSRISFVGRYAEWNYFLTNNSVLKEAIKIKEKL